MIKRLVAFDFDGTLIDSPLPEYGKLVWSEKKGIPYPHSGWWSKPESLDIDVFDIKPNPVVYSQYLKEISTPNTYVIILTSRLKKLEEQIKLVLEQNNIFVNEINTKNTNETKGIRILKYLDKFPEINEISVFDDSIDVIENEYNTIKHLLPDNLSFNIYFVNNNKLTLVESKIIDIIRDELIKLI